MTRRRGEAGVSLVETLVGLAILSGVLVATYAALTNALSVAARVAARRAAVETVALQVDRLRAGGPAGAVSLAGATGAYRWRVHVELLPRAPGRALRPLRITGELVPVGGVAAPETVLDTVILGRAQ